MSRQTNKSHGWNRQKSDYELAMIKVLKEARKPLSMPEILSRIIDKRLITIRGKTPDKSLYSIITRKENLRKERGENLLFKKTRDGVIVRYELN